jgi:hypothetical protein
MYGNRKGVGALSKILRAIPYHTVAATVFPKGINIISPSTDG